MSSEADTSDLRLLTPAAFWLPERFVASAWYQHAPFAFWVVDVHRPRVVVELGTHHGFSYLCFCQAVESLGTNTRCFAIDHWRGDHQAGFYDDDVLEQLASYHDPRYGHFSQLVVSTFDDAAVHFDDGSIDLLHIDGAHGLSEVTKDFERWLPKMSQQGVIIFHDINVHRDDFGVHVLWNDIKTRYPHFEFDHGHGLGVLGVGERASDTLGELFATSAHHERSLEVSRAFARLGAAVADRAIIELGAIPAEGPDVPAAHELQRNLEPSERRLAETTHELAVASSRLASLRTRAAEDRSSVLTLTTEIETTRARVHALTAEVAVLRSSTSWKVTAPMRRMMTGLRRLRRQASRAGKLLWWTVTLQLPKRLRAYRRYRRGEVDPPATTQSREADRFTKRGELYEEFSPAPPDRRPLAKLIAFYLPQFHAIPENDEWWGPGFTEWSNVMRGAPRFAGHYQPRTPGALGFYDLTDPKVMPRQVELARAAGIHAFCFYYYRFVEGPLLREPLERFLADPSLDMSFCLMWANENWTRTWDGYDREVLRSFVYDAEAERGWLEDLVRCFSDPRYVRIDGRPVVLVYRPSLIPDAANAFDRWRRHIEQALGVAPLIFNVQFTEMDPGEYGLDGAVEFPPHKLGVGLVERRSEVEVLDPDFNGTVRSYAELVATARSEPVPPYPLVRTVSPSWDNDARRPNWGFTITGSTPQLYEQWLEESIEYAIEHPVGNEALVFVNAWNEWAEAAYLEPDVHYGWAYLNATARALHRNRSLKGRQRVLIVGHDAALHGSQRTLLHIGRTLVGQFGVDVEFLLLEGGDLLDQYENVAPVRVASPAAPQFDGHLSLLRSKGYARAITSTVVSGDIVPRLKSAGFEVISLVHEMGPFIVDRGWLPPARRLAENADTVVFPAQFVADRFAEAVSPIDEGRILIAPQGLYRHGIDTTHRTEARESVRRELALESDQPLVLGVGYGDLRKGFDLFVQAAGAEPELAFVWLGDVEPTLRHWLIDAAAVPSNLRVVTHTEDVDRYYSASDILFLSSRDDAFPSTVIEALSAGLPVVGFEGRTGTGELIADSGQLVSSYDIAAAVKALRSLADSASPAADAESAERRRSLVETRFRFDDYAFSLLERLYPHTRRVSVIVPTYNYGRYLNDRLASIFEQTHPVFEIIVLDDASTDDTQPILEAIAAETGREFEVVRRSTNAGAIARQWLDGVRAARSDLVWIAEADDLSQPTFLERMVGVFDGASPAMAFCDSAQIDAEGNRIGESYRSYLEQGTDVRFDADFTMPGDEFLERLMSVRNPVLNASAVLFRRDHLLEVLERDSDELSTYRFAFDWHLYTELCRLGDVSFVASSLNVHRRHAGGATLGSRASDHIAEIARVQGHVRELLSYEGLEARQREYLDVVTRHLEG